MAALIMRVSVIVASLLGLASAASLRAQLKATNATEVKTQLNSTENETAEVVALRAKLQKMSAGLAVTLDPKGSVAQSKIGEALKAFSAELAQTLKDTETMKDKHKALKKLKDAQAGVKSLLNEMTERQMQLMKESDDQQMSLLIGVLMTRKNEPREKQMEVLSSPDFKQLPAVVAILKSNDTHTPLFQQLAAYMDEHSSPKEPTASTPILEIKPLAGKNGSKPDLTPIVTALDKRIHKLEETDKHRVKLHTEEMKQYDIAEVNASAKNNKKLVSKIQRIQKREDRQFVKEEALAHRDLESLKSAVDAIKKGDVKKLVAAQSALESSMKAMQAHANGFLVFIQEGHRVEGLDCPFCVAQCIEKCNAGGKSYSMCLSDCADAGNER